MPPGSRSALVVAVLLLSSLPAAACPHPPHAILRAQKFRDGGTVTATVTDSLGCALDCRYDGRFSSPTRGRMYIGKRLADRAAEARLLAVLAAVVDSTAARIARWECADVPCEKERRRARRQVEFVAEVLDKRGWR